MPAKIIYSEKELLDRIASGDQKAFQFLFDGYWDRIYANAIHFLKSTELARDLTQEVFIRIWISREKLTTVLNFEGYLYKVSKNLFLDHLRKNFITVSDTLSSLSLQTNEPDALQNLEINELQMQVSTAISRLPVQMQTAFKLSRINGLTHEQIAQQMKISKLTSQNYIARSLLFIRKHLRHHLGLYLTMFSITINFLKK